MNNYFTTLIIFLFLPRPVPAPVPRCSPFIFINKLAEWTNIWSDSNPYFPVPPCEYGGPLKALASGDLKSVFILAEPHKIPLHNLYEFVWLLKTGIPRMLRILAGNEAFIADPKILKEGYEHYTPYIRTKELGHNTERRPDIIDNPRTYKSILFHKLQKLAREGPDRHPTAFTPLGDLPARSVDPPKMRQGTFQADHYDLEAEHSRYQNQYFSHHLNDYLRRKNKYQNELRLMKH